MEEKFDPNAIDQATSQVRSDGPMPLTDLREFTHFDGALETGSRIWPVTFRAKVERSGEIAFEFAALPWNHDTVEIERIWGRHQKTVHYFALQGIALDGTSLRSESFYITGTAIQSDETGNFLNLRGKCSEGRFVQSHPAIEKIFVRQALVGFECFGLLNATCSLGSVYLRGMTNLPDDGGISGFLEIEPQSIPDDLDLWRANVAKLFQHIRFVMSFAASRQIKNPITQFRQSATLETKSWSFVPATGTGMAPFSRLDLQTIFAIAVDSFFEGDRSNKKIAFAVEWLIMPSTHTEVRLINAMTALEHLTESNLPTEDTVYLPSRRFDDLSKLMRRALPDLADGPETTFRRNLKGKMQDLNRLSLREKVERLVRLWNVDLDDLPQDGIRSAITARNAIVHRGHYYDDGPVTPEERDLMDHVLLVREIVTRLLFSALHYQGPYFSYVGGYHQATYPQAVKKTADC